jgi:predicted ArsR family transcriptional regulator
MTLSPRPPWRRVAPCETLGLVATDASTLETVKNIPVTRSQQAVLTALRDQPDLVDIEALARHLGRHPNTLREHLVGLLRAGLIVRHAAPAGGRGRPRWLYGCAETADVDENAELAAALAWRLARRARDPLAAARDVSRRWAGQIAERYAVSRQPTARVARAQVVEVMDGLGYDPVPDAALDRVALMRCPLLQVAKEVPEVVCNVHLGLVEELLEASGGDRRRVTLTPFAAPGRCDLRLMAPVTEEVRRAVVPSR